MAEQFGLSDLIGVPFEYGGRGPLSYDCFGLVKECWRRVYGIQLPDFLSPADQGAQAAVGIIQLQQWREVPCSAHAMAAIRIGRLVSHCGFMVDPHTMIHAWNRSGGVTLVRVDDEWRRRIAGFYVYAG
jgi:cell wall-associated NlpC family hydrolase